MEVVEKLVQHMSCYGLLDGLVSEAFPVKQGIRQGSVLSPWLYMCFNNEISELLDGIECWIKVESIGQISNVTVADDLALISPCVNGLQKMINKMEEYSNKWRFINTLIRANQLNAVQNENQKHKTGTKKWWNNVNNITGRKEKNSAPVSSLIDPNVINAYFQTINTEGKSL